MKDMLATRKQIFNTQQNIPVLQTTGNSIGQKAVLKKLNVKTKKEELENHSNKWVVATPERKAKYGEALID